MRVEARVDYGLRALIELSRHDRTVAGHELADALQLSATFLASVLSDLRRAGLIHTRQALLDSFLDAARCRNVAELAASV